MSIRYRSYTALDYKLMPIGNEISCINLKEKIRKEESLTDKSTNIILSFENARDKSLFEPLADEVSITRNTTIVFKVEAKGLGRRDLKVNTKGPGMHQNQRDPTEFGPYKPFANVKTSNGKYVCHRCGKVNDHNIRDCPTNNDPRYGPIHKRPKKDEPTFGVPQNTGPKHLPLQRPQDPQQQKINLQEERYKCEICRNIMTKPTKIGCCEKISCENCIKGKLKETRCTCPFCHKTPIYSSSLYPDKILQSEIEEYIRDKSKQPVPSQDPTGMQQQQQPQLQPPFPFQPQMPLQPQQQQQQQSQPPPQFPFPFQPPSMGLPQGGPEGGAPAGAPGQPQPGMMPGMGMGGMMPGDNGINMENLMRFFSSIMAGKEGMMPGMPGFNGIPGGMPVPINGMPGGIGPMLGVNNNNANGGDAGNNNNNNNNGGGNRGGRRGDGGRPGRDYYGSNRGCVPDITKLESLSKGYDGKKDGYGQSGKSERDKEGEDTPADAGREGSARNDMPSPSQSSSSSSSSSSSKRDRDDGRSDRKRSRSSSRTDDSGKDRKDRDDEIHTPPDSDEENSDDRRDRRERSYHRSGHRHSSRSRSPRHSRSRSRSRSHSRRRSDEDRGRERSHRSRDRHHDDDDHYHRHRHRSRDSDSDRRRRRRN